MKNLFQSFTKRGLSLLIALTMCMSLLPVNAFALEGEEGTENTSVEASVDNNQTTVDEPTTADEPTADEPTTVDEPSADEQPIDDEQPAEGEQPTEGEQTP